MLSRVYEEETVVTRVQRKQLYSKTHLAHEVRKFNATPESEDISWYLTPSPTNTPEQEYYNNEIDTESSSELSEVPTKNTQPDLYPAPIE